MTQQTKNLLLLFSACLLSVPVQATQTQQPIYIESDSLLIDDKQATSFFNGRVKFKQGSLVIHADSIRARSKNGSLSTVVIKGAPIKMDQKPEGEQPISATANKIEYFADTEMLHLYGDALLQQGQQEFRGEHIQYNSRSQQVIANNNQQTSTTNTNGQGRVKAVIMPKTKTDPAK